MHSVYTHAYTHRRQILWLGEVWKRRAAVITNVLLLAFFLTHTWDSVYELYAVLFVTALCGASVGHTCVCRLVVQMCARDVPSLLLVVVAERKLGCLCVRGQVRNAKQTQAQPNHALYGPPHILHLSQTLPPKLLAVERCSGVCVHKCYCVLSTFFVLLMCRCILSFCRVNRQIPYGVGDKRTAVLGGG